MGPRLAESVNEIAGDDVTPDSRWSPRNRHTPDTFLTENLWGVGSTAPYMHDGRATTLAEAILEHATRRERPERGAPRARRTCRAATSDKRAVIAFLDNLVLFKIEEEEERGRRGLGAECGGGRDAQTGLKIGPKGFWIAGE